MEVKEIYVTKTDIAKVFGCSRPHVYKLIKEIEEEIQKGRYNRYAFADGKVNKGVFLDYMTNRRRLRDKNLRKTVPPYNQEIALSYLVEGSKETA